MFDCTTTARRRVATLAFGSPGITGTGYFLDSSLVDNITQTFAFVSPAESSNGPYRRHTETILPKRCSAVV